MDATALTTVCKRSKQKTSLTLDKAFEIVMDCGVEAAVSAFLVLLMGGVVLGMASDIWRDMVPSRPPLFAEQTGVEDMAASSWRAVSEFFHQHQFVIVFGLLFAANVGGRFIRYSSRPEHRHAAVWFRRISRQVSEEWLGLIVINAFTAMVSVFVLRWASGFSLTQLLWHFVLALSQPLIHAVGGLFPSNGFFRLIGGLFSWYGDNQFKFTFWLIYTASICDDLGLPNLKTLARRLWARLFGAKATDLPTAPAT